MWKSPGAVDHAEALVDAERQMADHQVDLSDRLMERVAPYVPKGLSADEKRHLIDGLIEASSELCEVAQRLETFRQSGSFLRV
jgi:hypothetical protein